MTIDIRHRYFRLRCLRLRTLRIGHGDIDGLRCQKNLQKDDSATRIVQRTSAMTIRWIQTWRCLFRSRSLKTGCAAVVSTPSVSPSGRLLPATPASFSEAHHALGFCVFFHSSVYPFVTISPYLCGGFFRLFQYTGLCRKKTAENSEFFLKTKKETAKGRPERICSARLLKLHLLFTRLRCSSELPW